MSCPKCDDWMAREIGPCPEHAIKLSPKWILAAYCLGSGLAMGAFLYLVLTAQ